MSKVSGSYERVTRGVSQQVPQDRYSGQHFEQVNFISDPVRGLCRRRGSVNEDEKVFADFNASFLSDTLLDTEDYKTFSFYVDGVEYALVYRTKNKPLNSQAPFAFCFNKDTRKFVDVVYSTSDPLITALQNGGVSSITSASNFTFIAGNTVTSSYTTTELWNNIENLSKGVIWIRSGAYARLYTVDLQIQNGVNTYNIHGEYKTMSANYPGYLDTSGLDFNDPDYQNQLNAATSAYNAALTQWITDAANDILPPNICQKLIDSMTTYMSTHAIPSTVLAFDLDINSIGLRANAGSGYVIQSLIVNDSGDQTLARGVANIATSTTNLTAEHYNGKVVKITPNLNNNNDADNLGTTNNPKLAYYVKAISKNGSDSNHLSEVEWIECAGTQVDISGLFGIATIFGNTLYIAGTPAKLQALTGLTVPNFESSQAGDLITSNLPDFLTRKIDYLGMFQDRLVIGTGATLWFSVSSEYFNFFRNTMLSVEDNDPISIFSLEADNDTIKSSVTFDKNIIFFGKRKQYSISGRSTFTPSTALITAISAHEDTNLSYPQESGNFIFFNKYRNGYTSLHQLQVGLVADSPQSTEVSSQLATYLHGKPVELLTATSPNHILVRTDLERNTVYDYTYLDDSSGQQRLQDSWSKWTWDINLGYITGLTYKESDICIFTLRHGLDRTGVARFWIASDKFVFDTTLSDKPYLDSNRPLSVFQDAGNNGFLNINNVDNTYKIVFDNTVDEFNLGQRYSNLASLLSQYPTKVSAMVIGKDSPAYVIPTNPYVRDQNGKAIINGILTVIKFSVSISDTGGLTCNITNSNGDADSERQIADYSGRILGTSSSILNKQILSTRSVDILIGKNINNFRYKILSNDWLPLNITAIEYVGQYFYNQRRI